jgi:pimeloyl-ACP methyl ester carboxylesterase
MDVILIPGFWLDASSWDEVSPPITAAGHTVHAMTLPGLDSPATDRSGIRLADHVSAVVELIDSLDGRVALVGHSGGGAIIGAAADARPSRIARAIYVDSGPIGDGGVINDDLPAENGEIPLPDWGAFEDEELGGLTDDLRAWFRARAIPEPEHVATDPVRLTNDERYSVPTTMIASTMPASLVEQLLSQGHPFLREFSLLQNREVVELPTGHWPQFSRPHELGTLIAEALAR